jgi:GT2 family glycosyltransferase
MVEALEKDSAVRVVSPKLLYPDGRIQYAGASFTKELHPYHIGRFKKADQYNKEREIPWATFACALIRNELLGDGLDEEYKLGTFEDVDFCTKARFDGYKILYTPQATVYHYEGASVFTVNPVHYGQQQAANANLFFSRWGQWVKMNINAYPELYAEVT